MIHVHEYGEDEYSYYGDHSGCWFTSCDSFNPGYFYYYDDSMDTFLKDDECYAGKHNDNYHENSVGAKPVQRFQICTEGPCENQCMTKIIYRLIGLHQKRETTLKLRKCFVKTIYAKYLLLNTVTFSYSCYLCLSFLIFLNITCDRIQDGHCL